MFIRSNTFFEIILPFYRFVYIVHSCYLLQYFQMFTIKSFLGKHSLSALTRCLLFVNFVTHLSTVPSNTPSHPINAPGSHLTARRSVFCRKIVRKFKKFISISLIIAKVSRFKSKFRQSVTFETVFSKAKLL